MLRRLMRRGFTMLEILIAVVMLGLALIPIFGMLLFGTRNTGKASDIIIATHLATEKMELMKSKEFDAIQMIDSDSDGIGDNELEDPWADNGQIYEIGRHGMKYETSGKTDNGEPIIVYPKQIGRFGRFTTVEPRDEIPTRSGDTFWGYKLITVHVTWRDAEGNQVDTGVTLRTLVANDKAIDTIGY